MKHNRKPSDQNYPNKLNLLVHNLLMVIALIGGLGIILYTTLKEFDFQFRRLSTAEYFGGFQILPSSVYDFPRNVFLFIPFGFGLAAYLTRLGCSKRLTLFSVLIISFALTLLVESLQFFLPGRSPTVADLLANSLGGLAGLGCYRVWEQRTVVSQRIRALASVPRNVLIAGMVYMLFLMALGGYLQNKTQLTGWDQFTMLIGNERTGNRPWSGTVTELAILDKAVSGGEAADLMSGFNVTAVAGSSLVAYYPLSSPSTLSDQTGNLPDFGWQKKKETGPLLQDEDLKLDGNHWLETEQPVSYLIERLQDSSQFAILMTVAPADLQQTGPARILTISLNPRQRNLMLGQDGHDLILRFRSPMSGQNGAAPELAVPGIFTSESPQKLLISFDGLALQVYKADGHRAGRVEIGPGLTLLRAFVVSELAIQQIRSGGGWILMLVFYAFFFIPLGVLLALLIAQIESPTQRRIILLLGIVLPSLLLELVLSTRNGFEPRLLNILLGAFVIGITTILLTFSTRQPLGLRRVP